VVRAQVPVRWWLMKQLELEPMGLAHRPYPPMLKVVQAPPASRYRSTKVF
jgi:hypothetical protein